MEAKQASDRAQLYASELSVMDREKKELEVSRSTRPRQGSRDSSRSQDRRGSRDSIRDSRRGQDSLYSSKDLKYRTYDEYWLHVSRLQEKKELKVSQSTRPPQDGKSQQGLQQKLGHEKGRKNIYIYIYIYI